MLPTPSSTSPLAPSPPLPAKCSMAGRCALSKTTSTPVFPRTALPFFSSRSKALPKQMEEHTSELQSRLHLVCRLLLEKKKKTNQSATTHHYIHLTSHE